MDHTALAAYFVALTALTVAPGPLMAVLVARSLSHSVGGAMAFSFGLCLGQVFAVCAVALGIGGLALTQPEWFAVVKYMGVAYLLWLSYRIWMDGSASKSEGARETGLLSSMGAGLALCLGNPATVLLYVLLLPTVAPQGIGTLDQFALVLLVTFAAVGIVFFGTIGLARQVRRMIASPGSSRLLSRGTAATIALTSLVLAVA
jgi:threonine/homoserine/homoserine lactone efflux protein